MRATPFHHDLEGLAPVIAASLCVVALLLLPPLAHAQGMKKDNKPYLSLSDLDRTNLTANAHLADALRKWAAAIEMGDSIEAMDQTNRISGVKYSLGTRNLIPAADLCIAVGRKALLGGNYEGAVLAARNAALFGPDYPASHFFLARALFTRNKMDVNGVGMAIAAGIKSAMTNRLERDRVISVLLKYVIFSLSLSFFITFLTLFIVHYKTLFTELSAYLPPHPEGRWRTLTGLLVVMTPIAIGGPLFFILALPLFLWPYLKRNGAVMVALFTVCVLLAPYMVKQMAKGITIQSADTYRALYLLSKETWDFETQAVLEKQSAANPDNDLLAFALGLLYKLSGDRQAAIRAYNAILAKAPEDVRALVNKGNVYFAAKQWDRAEGMYQEAIKTHPNSVEARYNLSRVYTELFLNKKSDAEYQQARSIDPKKIDSFRDMAQEHPDKKVVDFPITRQDLRRYEMELEKVTAGVSEGWWNAYLAPITMKVYKIVSLVFLALLMVVIVLWRTVISNLTCTSCGAAFCPPIRTEETSPKCNQCVAAQSSKSGVSSAKKDKKRKEIREYKDQRSHIAGLLDRLAPGMGRTYFQEPLSGALLTFVTSLIIVYGVRMLYEGVVIEKAQLGHVAQEHLVFLGVGLLYWVLMNTVLRKDFY